MKNTVGELIKKRRRELGLTQDDLSKKIGTITRATVAHYEQGRNEVPVNLLPKISNLLGVKISYFFNDDAEEDIKNSLPSFYDDEENNNVPKKGKIIYLTKYAHDTFRIMSIKDGISCQKWIENYLEQSAIALRSSGASKID